MNSHVFQYLFIQKGTFESPLPPSKPFFVILHLRKHLTLGAQYNESLDSVHFPEALEKLTLVGQLVSWLIWKKQMVGVLKNPDIMEGQLSSQKIDDFGKRWKRVFFLEENGKMHGLKRKRSTMLVKLPWILSPSKTSARMVWCLPWKFLDLETMRFIDSIDCETFPTIGEAILSSSTTSTSKPHGVWNQEWWMLVKMTLVRLRCFDRFVRCTANVSFSMFRMYWSKHW